jgi:hypothetical protein
MRTLLLALVLLAAPVARGEEEGAAKPVEEQVSDDAYRAAYKALTPDELQKKHRESAPKLKVRRLDVSERMRSASFGRKTALLIPLGRKAKGEFFVEKGPSTNHQATDWYGPFELPGSP